MLSIPNREKNNKIKRKETAIRAQFRMVIKHNKLVILSTKSSANLNSLIPTGVRGKSLEIAQILAPKIVSLMHLMMQRTTIVTIKTRIKTYPM